MARNRQRAKDRKQRQRDPSDGPVDDAPGKIVDPSLAGGAPPDDLGSAPPVIDYDDDDGDSGDMQLDSDHVGSGAGDVAAPPGKRKAAVPRFATFLRACWAELQRVQWPNRKQVGQATAVVLGFVVIAGSYLGLADVVFSRLVDVIL